MKMREIKFRGKVLYTERRDLPFAEWVYGNYSKEDGYCSVNHRAVYPETVGQYTGFDTSDGKPIYEGDIIQCVCENGFKHRAAVVYWSEAHKGFYVRGVGDSVHDDRNQVLGVYVTGEQVVGNIIDTPELLETKLQKCGNCKWLKIDGEDGYVCTQTKEKHDLPDAPCNSFVLVEDSQDGTCAKCSWCTWLDKERSYVCRKKNKPQYLNAKFCKEYYR